jgi:hypothetical protein
VDQVWAVPLLTDGYGRFTPEMFSPSNRKTFDLENGKFIITLSGSISADDWVLLLVNSDADNRADTIVSYVSISDLNERLLQFPIKKMSGTIELGNIQVDDDSDDESTADTGLDELATACSLSYGQLRQMAKTDDLVKSIRNLYCNATFDNSGNVSSYYQPVLQHRWLQNILTAENQFSTHEDHYQGYGLEIYFDSDDISWSDLIDPSIDAVNLFPPTDISIVDFYSQSSSLDYGVDVPIPSDGPFNPNLDSAYDNDLGFCAFKNVHNLIRLQYASTPVHTWSGFEGIIPEGDWLLTDSEQNETFANFDFSFESPFNDDGTSKIYIPSLKITTGGDDKISVISVRWLLYDQTTETYEVVTDTDILMDLSSEIRMDLNCQIGSGVNTHWDITNLDLISDASTEYEPEDVMYLNKENATGLNLVWVSIRYTLNGATFIFDWDVPND